VLLIAAAVSLYLIQVNSVTTAGYELQRLEVERKAWLARNEQLELELAKKRSHIWAESQAAATLGMVPGGTPIYVVVRELPATSITSIDPSETEPSAAVDAVSLRLPAIRLPPVMEHWLSRVLGGTS
jgi:hypothetical protein